METTNVKLNIVAYKVSNFAFAHPYIHSFLCDVITHPCLKFNNGIINVEARTWLSNYISHKTIDIVTYSLHKLRLTHWGLVTHICVGKQTNIGSDNGLSPGRRQTIICTNDGILLIRTLGTNFNEILREIHSFSFKKTHLKMSSAKWRLSRLGLNELSTVLSNMLSGVVE